MMKGKSKRTGFVVVMFAFSSIAHSQQLIGTRGLLNIPTADMYAAGTFNGGACLLQRRMMVDAYDYATGIYYIDFTPFSFVEITFRETLRKTRKSRFDARMGYYQQDRSTSIRLQPLKERTDKWWPSVVVGVNDIYSDHGNSEYAAVYGVLSKQCTISHFGRFALTAGYFNPFDNGSTYDGCFGGISFSPSCADNVQLMAEYDTRGFNCGVSALLFRHLNVFCMTREFDGLCAGVSYHYTIKF